MKKIPTIISFMSVIMSFEFHRQALLKVLNDLNMMPDISLDKFKHLANQIQVTNDITFTNDEIDLASIRHTKTLYISLKCKGYTIVKFLIDNGSTLNVLLIIILKQLPIDNSLIKPSQMMVKTFDKKVVRDFDQDLEIASYTFLVPF